MKKEIKKVFNKLKTHIKNIWNIACKIHKKSGHLRIYIIFDMLWSYIVYTVNYDEYYILSFYNVVSNKRNTYLTHRKHKRIIRHLYNKKNLNILNDSKMFYSKYKKFFSNEISNINSISYKEYENIVLKNKKVMCISDINKVKSSFEYFDSSKFRSPAFMLEKIKKDKLKYIEPYISEHKELNKITDSVISLNIVTLNVCGDVEAVSSSISFNEDGKTYHGFIDSKNATLKKNLICGEDISERVVDGIKIPLYDKAIELALECARELNEVREVEWNIFISSKKVYLIGASLWDDYIYYQMPEYNKIGLIPYYKKKLKI
jgi:hypothetical protein